MRTRDLIRLKKRIEQYVAEAQATCLTLQAVQNMAAIDEELEFRGRYRYRWELLTKDWGFDFSR